jgi:hypothetical protein
MPRRTEEKPVRLTIVSIRTEYVTDTNERVIVDFRRLRHLRINVDSFPGYWHLTDVGSIIDVSEKYGASFYRVCGSISVM